MTWYPSDNLCTASLSADDYKRDSMADGTYDEARWQWMDGGHERCPERAVKFVQGEQRVYRLCEEHASGGTVFPYFPPGESCQQPCCAGLATWSVGVWTPSKRLKDAEPDGDAEAADLPTKEQGLHDLYQRAANTSLLAIDPDESVAPEPAD